MTGPGNDGPSGRGVLAAWLLILPDAAVPTTTKRPKSSRGQHLGRIPKPLRECGRSPTEMRLCQQYSSATAPGLIPRRDNCSPRSAVSRRRHLAGAGGGGNAVAYGELTTGRRCAGQAANWLGLVD